MKTTTAPHIDTFTRSYIEASLFCSTDDSGGELLNENYSIVDIYPETLEKMVSDCANFQFENDIEGYGDEQAGQDFWFTRNGHGCGFWENDHGTPAQCDKLNKAAKAMGHFDLYIGDDGKIHGS